MMASGTAFRTALETIPDWPKDPLHYFDEFPLRARHFPGGVPLELSTNSPQVIAAARQSWSAFPKILEVEPIHVRVGVSKSDRTDLPPAPAIRGQRGMISIIGDAENFGICDLTSGFSFGWVTPATVADPAFFRYHFLDLMAGLLFTPMNYGVIHSACVSFNGRGVLLCGHSKAGKSTLSFACAQRGWTFISDDAVYTIRKNPGRRVIGNPLYLRLRSDAPALFRQLEKRAVILRQNGEFGFEIPTSDLPEITTAFTCEIDHIVFLHRTPAGAATISSFPKELARKWMENVMDLTFTCNANPIGNRKEMFLADPKAREEQKTSLDALLAGSVHELCYHDLDSAIDCLESIVGNGG
jgi:hypothetical protein